MAVLHTDNNGVSAISIDDDGSIGHEYRIKTEDHQLLGFVSFQNGSVKKNGVNGITNEALLAILIHRLRYLNEQFSCEENDIAIRNIEIALQVLEIRTRDRMHRGVEGVETA